MAITCVGPAVGIVLELVDIAGVAVAVGAGELEAVGAWELEAVGAWELEAVGAWELEAVEVVEGAAVAGMVVVGVTILGMTGQQFRSSHGSLSFAQSIELQNSS